MSDATSGPAADAAPAQEPIARIDVQAPAITQESFSDASEAARYLASLRSKKPQAESAPQAAPAEQDTGDEPAAAQQEADPGEEIEATEAEELPPIEPPRSWTKEAKDRWAGLPRETQEYLAQRESERDRGLQRSQNEIAEQRKAAQAAREAAEQARKDYEARLPALMQALDGVNQQNFADIRTMDDVVKLQSEDPFRFQAWQVHQMRLQAAKAETDRITREQQGEAQSKWASHVQNEGAKFQESLSEADKAKLGDLMKEAPKFLNERGFTQQELADLWNGKDRLSLHDHRIQSLILDGMKYQHIQNAPKVVASKDLPPVQKPGTPRAGGAEAEIQALERRFNKDPSEANGFALLEARERLATRRRA